MTKVSRIYIDPKRLQSFVDSLWNCLALCGSRMEVKEFFTDLFTQTEIIMFAKRIQIAKMLLKGYDYKTIETYVRIGSPTISRVHEWLKSQKPAKKVVERLVDMEEAARREYEKSQDPILGKRIPGEGTIEAIAAIITQKLAHFYKRKTVERYVKKERREK